MLDSPDDVCAGQAWFQYPATSVLFSNCLTEGVHFRGEAKRTHAVDIVARHGVWQQDRLTTVGLGALDCPIPEM
jgi:hypothetical protein